MIHHQPNHLFPFPVKTVHSLPQHSQSPTMERTVDPPQEPL